MSEKILGLDYSTPLLNAINSFSERNNISIYLELHGDGSGRIVEFWEGDDGITFKDQQELFSILLNTNLQKDENGLCISPITIVKPEPPPAAG